MGENSQSLHEADLPADLIDRHRAIASIMEELEAVDWYDQRVAATTDPELAAILAHNRDEEKEHACMVLEWLRRNDATLDRMMRTYLFTTGSILEVEEEAEHGGGSGDASARADDPGSPDLGIGTLRNRGKDLP
jgi:ferritin-like protein